MMYRHLVTIYDAQTLSLVKTIPDRVDLSELGFPGYSGTDRGPQLRELFRQMVIIYM